MSLEKVKRRLETRWVIRKSDEQTKKEGRLWEREGMKTC